MVAVVASRAKYPIASLPIEKIRALANDLTSRSKEIGCLVFPAVSDYATALIVFAGNGEEFHMLSVARYAACKVLYFQDALSHWYRGSAILPSMLELTEFIAQEIAGCRPLFFGQSSGGYAAIVAATQFEGGVAIACSPQTFSDIKIKQSIIAPGIGLQSAPSDVLDLRDVLQNGCSTSEINVISAINEAGNPARSHFWMDHLHLARIIDLANVRIFLTEADNHSIVFRRAEAFASLLRDCLATNSDERTSRLTSFCAQLGAHTEAEHL